MSSTTPRLIITGATGQLGRVVHANIAERKPGADVTAMVRTVASATDLADLGVDVVPGDYKEPASPDAAFDRALFAKNLDLCLISSRSKFQGRLRFFSGATVPHSVRIQLVPLQAR